MADAPPAANTTDLNSSPSKGTPPPHPHVAKEKFNTLLIIYAGGTIGMKKGENGYEPVYGYLPEMMMRIPLFNDPTYPGERVSQPSKEMIRVKWDIIEFSPLLDSSNMDQKDWVKIGQTISDNYKLYDAFLVLHGTDTMAYTASALSFMLENLGKTVVLTGSQIPLSEQRNDAIENMLGSLIMATHYNIPEVCVFFANRLLRGNRSVKSDAEGLVAFDSPNLEPLGSFGVSVHINRSNVLLSKEIAPMALNRNLETNITVLHLFPGINSELVRQQLQPPVKGAILRSFGCGNAPMRKDFLDVLTEASDRGVVIVNVTQCTKGNVSPLYETGIALLKCGVIAGRDMTTEAALTKLSCLLGKGLPVEKVRELMGENLRGEMYSPVLEMSWDNATSKFIKTVADAVNAQTTSDELHLWRNLVPLLFLKAVGNCDLKSVQELHSMGASANASDYDGRTPLHIAACDGNVQIVQLLLGMGAGVHHRDRWGNTPLSDAKANKNVAVQEVLISAGALT